jgi:hypothetical protein
MAKDMVKGPKGKGYMGGGPAGGFVTTPMNAPKKGMKGGKSK